MRIVGLIPLLALLCGACGGSSSETPPPLEPDPARLIPHGEGIPGQDPAAPPARAASERPEPAAAVVPARSAEPARRQGAPVQTWGSASAPPRTNARELAPEPEL